MSQEDFDIKTADANTGVSYRAAVNAALQALASSNSGATAPSTDYPFQIYVNTTASPAEVYIRKAASSDWVKWGYIDAATQALIVDTVEDANTIDGAHAGTGADEVLLLDGAGLLTLANLPATLTGKDADSVDGKEPGVGADDILLLDGSAEVPAANLPAIPAANLPSQSIRDISRGLVIKNTAANPTYQMDIDADEVMLQSTDPYALAIRSVNLTVDITAGGVNGLDTGSEAVSTWYYLWVIYNPTTTTTAGLLSMSSTAPTMPAGYTYKALVGAVYNGSGGNLVLITQKGNSVSSESILVLSGGTGSPYDPINSVPMCPVNAKTVKGHAEVLHASGAGSYEVKLASSSSNASGEIVFSDYSPAAATPLVKCPFSGLVVDTVQTIYYELTSGTSANVYVSGWEY